MTDFYDYLTNIGSLGFNDKSALIIGGSEISRQFVLALGKFGITDITIVAQTGKYLSKFCNENKITLLSGGFEKHLPEIEKKDLVIIAPPIPLTIKAAKMAIEFKHDNILIEKPGSLYKEELESFSNDLNGQTVRVGYNRLAYPNLHKLLHLVEQEGGITSCRFTFTERLSTMDFEKDAPEVYERWGISNSLHVITMAWRLIGLPKKLNSFQHGKLDWHKSGSIFVGHGISENDIPFSYHADWGSGGRWGIEVNTRENSYQLIPLEDLYACPRDTGNWNKVSFELAYPDVKQGFPEEIAIMLSSDKQQKSILPDLKSTFDFNKIAEKIFNYN